MKDLELGMYCYNKMNRKLGIGQIISFQSNNNVNIRYKNDIEIVSIGNVIASHNIIDLIEVGDYVNGFPVEDYFHEYNEEKDILENIGVVTTECYLEDINFSWILEKDIKTILTEEQMEANQYVIK